jgi:hypothetical protein
MAASTTARTSILGAYPGRRPDRRPLVVPDGPGNGWPVRRVDSDALNFHHGSRLKIIE